MTATVQAFPGATPGVDMEKAAAFLQRFLGDMGSAMTGVMCALGDRLGLFQSLAEQGPATSAELAARTGLDERYVREWLHCLASAGYLEGDKTNPRFALPPEHAPALAFQGSPFYVAGAFQLVPALAGMLGAVADAFRSGDGVAPDRYPAELYEGMERMSASWLDSMLVPQWLPAVDGLVDRLEDGIRVADVGCGRGRALVLLARAFPNSRFVGYDSFARNVEHARSVAEADGVAERVAFQQADAARELPGNHTHGLVTAFDVLHDVADPDGLLRRVHAALRPDGVFLLVENAAGPATDQGGAAATILYATSTLYCVPTSLANGGPALGTLGLPASEIRQRCVQAGFGSVRPIPIDNPFNALYEIRP